MSGYHISLMGKNDIQGSVRVLSLAMLDAKLHVAVLLGKGENERQEIEKMFTGLFIQLPGIVFLAKEKQQIVGVMRMKSCEGFKPMDDPKEPEDENVRFYEKFRFKVIAESDIFNVKNRYMLRISQIQNQPA